MGPDATQFSCLSLVMVHMRRAKRAPKIVRRPQPLSGLRAVQILANSILLARRPYLRMGKEEEAPDLYAI